MFSNNVGTPVSLIIGGPTFRAFGDCDIAQVLAEKETELLPTSGSPMVQMKKVSPVAKSVDIAVNPSEFVIISAFAESPIDIILGWVDPSLTVWQGKGRIKLGDYSHYNGKLSAEFQFTVKPTKYGL